MNETILFKVTDKDIIEDVKYELSVANQHTTKSDIIQNIMYQYENAIRDSIYNFLVNNIDNIVFDILLENNKNILKKLANRN